MVTARRTAAAPVGPKGSTEALVAELVAAIGADRVGAGDLERTLYGRDASGITAGRPAVVCFPGDTAQVQACVTAARRHGRAFVARGSGTGLAGGAVPVGGGASPGEGGEPSPVVIVTTRMNRILAVDAAERVAWVQPGVLNLDLTRAVAGEGLHFAPDPSSQQACTVGGNVANNSGGPHCLAEGVTTAHVLAVEVVLPDGTLALLGGLEPDAPGYDLRGAFVGSEGTMGIATRIAVRLTPDPPSRCTLLLDFDSVDTAAEAVSGIIAAGLVPAALEMLEGRMIQAVEDFVHAGLPVSAAAVLLVEVDGLAGGVEAAAATVEEVGRAHGGRVRRAAGEEERAAWWKARKSAFGAVARIAPNYYLHDTVVPRRRLVEVLREVHRIAAEQDVLVLNVFHAGDGNLHPLLVFDARQPGVLERVHAAGAQIVEASLAAGGVLSGEHGIGLEKRPFMDRMFGPADLDAQARLRRAFDPDGVSNPHKVLPAGAGCGDLQGLPEGVWV